MKCENRKKDKKWQRGIERMSNLLNHAWYIMYHCVLTDFCLYMLGTLRESHMNFISIQWRIYFTVIGNGWEEIGMQIANLNWILVKICSKALKSSRKHCQKHPKFRQNIEIFFNRLCKNAFQQNWTQSCLYASAIHKKRWKESSTRRHSRDEN